MHPFSCPKLQIQTSHSCGTVCNKIGNRAKKVCFRITWKDNTTDPGNSLVCPLKVLNPVTHKSEEESAEVINAARILNCRNLLPVQHRWNQSHGRASPFYFKKAFSSGIVRSSPLSDPPMDETARKGEPWCQSGVPRNTSPTLSSFRSFHPALHETGSSRCSKKEPAAGLLHWPRK